MSVKNRAMNMHPYVLVSADIFLEQEDTVHKTPKDKVDIPS